MRSRPASWSSAGGKGRGREYTGRHREPWSGGAHEEEGNGMRGDREGRVLGCGDGRAKPPAA